MLFLNILSLMCCFLISNEICADNVSKECCRRKQSVGLENINLSSNGFISKKPGEMLKKGTEIRSPRYATSSRVATTPEKFLIIHPPSFPATTLLSRRRNLGFKHGAVELIHNGVKVLKSGTYLINVSGSINNPTSPDNTQTLIFLVQDGKFTLNPEKIFVNVAYLPSQASTTFQGTQIVKLKRGTKLSLVATAVGPATGYALLVVTWNISVSELSSSS